MKNIFKLILSLLIAINLAGCNDKQSRRISAIIPLVESRPDSALTLLNKIDQAQLSEKAIALYSMAYTIAQDKTGIDVDNDSLLRNAYNWYNDKPADSLYAKCEYYMGKYYALNDSSEKALRCFSNSVKAAKRQNDYYTQSLALVQSSLIVREYDPDLAIQYSNDADKLYNKVKNGSGSNKVYTLLNLAECYSFKEGGIKQSFIIAWQAVRQAIGRKDTLALGDAYQDLSAFWSLLGNKDSVLYTSKLSFLYKKKHDTSSVSSLAWAYCDVDSLQASERLIKSISRREYLQYGSSIYSLLYAMALKKNNLQKANVYKDSLVAALESMNSANAKAKDAYYNKVIRKERQRAREQNESRFKTWTIISIIIVSIIIIAFILYISRYRRAQMQRLNEEQQERKRLIIEHQSTQISTMRNFLMRKISILHKLESLKTGMAKQVLLSDFDWEELEVFLNSSDNEFVERLKRDFPALTPKDIKFLMLVRLKFPYSAIAQIYNIEPKSVKQKLFLIKEKLGLKDSPTSAKKFIEDY